MHDKIVVTLPYPVKVGITVNIPRKIGFSFTNLSHHLFQQAHKLKGSDDLEEWAKNNGGEIGLLSETLYWSAVAYGMTERKKDNFTRDGLRIAFSSASKDVQESVLSVWQSAQAFGLVETKKKVVRKRRK